MLIKWIGDQALTYNHYRRRFDARLLNDAATIFRNTSISRSIRSNPAFGGAWANNLANPFGSFRHLYVKRMCLTIVPLVRLNRPARLSSCV